MADEELREFGYAPGGYISTCIDCNGEVWNVDKRCRVCRPCAIKRRNTHLFRSSHTDDRGAECAHCDHVHAADGRCYSDECTCGFANDASVKPTESLR
jgi:hypothetical protein